MTRNNKTRHALLMSMMSILLCVAMLIGSTFAWFTDTASTAVNEIQAGTLDIELEMLTKDANENEATWKDAEGKTLSFKKASTASGTEVLWEPGCTYELPTLRVVNNGNLAFKYKIVVSGATGDTKLLEAIDFTVKFNGVEVNLDNWEGILLPKGKTATSDTAEEVETSSSLVISGHMKEEAGNEYRGLSVDGIGITVYATQYTYEYDSYNNKYDLNSMYVFDDYVNVTKAVSYSGDTVIKDNEENAAITATIPQGSLVEGITELALIKKPTENPSSVKVEIGESALTTDVKIINTATKEVISATEGKYFTIDILLGQVDLQKFYHKGVQLTSVESKSNLTSTGLYYYDLASGIVTFTTDSFSTFTAVFKFSGGNGTADYPYLMATANDLFSFAEITNSGTEYSGKYLKVTNNIDLGNEEWTPIGQKAGNKFNGTFDGNNKTVSGLKITSNNTVNNNESFDGYGALFGAIEGDAVVKNLTVSGTVTCASAAGIVARMNKGTVENCTSNVTVTGSAKAGGIVCLTNTSGCTIKNCTNNGTVSGPTTTGGIAAIVNSETTVKDCTNNGTIGGSSSQIAGGIVATINSKWTNVQIESCTNNAAVTSQSSGTLTGKSGGIVGSVEGGASGCSGTIKNCSNSGTISSTGDKSASGDIVGTIVDDFVIGLTVENNGCNSNDFSGTGTASEPYIIDSAETLSTLSANVASGKIYCYQYFKLSTDLDMKDKSFIPIGNSTYSFKGTFDGNSKTISNLSISSTGSEPLGLFVSTNRATIKDLILDNVTVSGTTKVGALVGSMKGGTVENVKLTGTGNVTSSSYYAGGIIGYAESATISSCKNESTGEVKESTNNETGAGGIIGGALKNTTVTNCTNSCKVSGAKYAGGIAGQVSAGTVSGCTNSGAVTVSGNFAGGIVGLAQLETVVSGNTNSGAVTATNQYAGGIVGAAVLSNKATGNMTISGNTNTGTLTANKNTDAIVALSSDKSDSYSINVSGTNPSSQDGGSD